MNVDELRAAMQRAGVEWAVSDEPIEAEPRLGYQPSEGVPPLDEQEEIARRLAAAGPEAAAPEYPSAYDLRDVGGSNFVTAIRDQGACGSCVAFGSCAAVEGTLSVQENDADPDVDLSEAYLFYCVAASQGSTCADGWYPKVALATLQQQGTPDESGFPYTAGDQECAACSDWEARATKISGWHPLQTPAEMKAWISSRGPIVGSMKVYEDFEHYRGGTYRHVAGRDVGGHCICLVGYDDQQGHWIGKNSWDTRWGEDGFFRIAYGECAIDAGALAVDGVQPRQNVT